MAKKQIKEESHKLVIAISSSALINLDHSHQNFNEQAIQAYAKHQQENESSIL
jgi:5'-nucleotidase